MSTQSVRRARRRGAGLLARLTDTRSAVWILIAALFIVYVALPILVDAFFLPNPYFVQLAQLTILACAAIAVGYALPLFDSRFAKRAPRIAISAPVLHGVVWGTFMIFLVLTFATAESVPLVSALRGADTNELSLQRGEFLKARVGAEAALLYLSTIFVGTLLPYSLVRLFMDKSRYRYALMLVFLGFSISFLAKSLFVNVVLPLLYLATQQKKGGTLGLLGIVFGSVALLYLVTLLAFGGQSEFDVTDTAAIAGDFFGAGYLPSGTIDHLIWRSVAVPMFTASDTLLVFQERFNGQVLWGATSSFLAAIFGLERIPLERLVFEQQWSWNDTANSNAVYLAEAFVDFGWAGVVAFSIFIGQSFRWFRKSRDQAFKSLWMIYALTVFTSGLIGTMLSTGYVLIFGLALFVKLKPSPAAPSVVPHRDPRGPEPQPTLPASPQAQLE